ncbi:UNVERIFIED_CONTAM: hypothetical protein FKN15_070662 [Acipenser sinensis]
MAEIAPTAAPASVKTVRTTKKIATKPKKAGPSVSDLIVKTVSASKERSGVSLAALKKALAAGGYDVEKNNSRVNTAVKSLVSKETLLQTKGVGASGSFRLNKKVVEAKDKAAKKKAAPKPKKPAVKKAAPKKAPAKKPATKKAATKSPKKAKKPAAKKAATKSPKKAKKPAAKKPAKSPKKERSGVSLAALKKTLAAGGYDVEKNNSRVNTAVKSLVSKETLLQTKGVGASGSFRLNKKVVEAKDKAAKKKAAPKPKKPAVKKAAPKKAPAKKPATKKAATKSPKKAKKPAAKKAATKSPKKAKKPAAKKPAKSPKKVAKPKAAKTKRAAPKRR